MPYTVVDAGQSEVTASPGCVAISAHDDSSCGCAFTDKAEFEAFVKGIIEAGRIAFPDFEVK